MALTSYAGNVVDLDDKAKRQIADLIPLKAHNYPSAPVHRTHRTMIRNKISTLNAVTANDIDMSQFEAYLRRCGKYTEDEIQQILEYAANNHPATGDIIFIRNSDGQDHTGIVIAYDEESEKVYTVEGNAGDAVRNRSYNITHGDIVGFGSNGGMNNQSLISKVDGTAYEGDLGTR